MKDIYIYLKSILRSYSTLREDVPLEDDWRNSLRRSGSCHPCCDVQWYFVVCRVDGTGVAYSGYRGSVMGGGAAAASSLFLRSGAIVIAAERKKERKRKGGGGGGGKRMLKEA
jgi:hypothetical protein